MKAFKMLLTGTLALAFLAGCTPTQGDGASSDGISTGISSAETSSAESVTSSSVSDVTGEVKEGSFYRIQQDMNTEEVYNIPLEITNPAVDSGLADPDIHRYGDTYWIFGTQNGALNVSACYSTDNMKTWTRIDDIVDMSTFPWATTNIWAPCAMYYNGKYYIAFSNGDSYETNPNAGINIGVADKPEGPYKSVTDGPVVYEKVSDGCLIDQDFFVDEDGTIYLYFGGAGYCSVCMLNDTLTDIVPFEDGDRFKAIEGLNEYVEGPQVAKRGDTYYMFYSKGVWSNESYGGCYATSDSPLGPFTNYRQILQTANEGNFRGPGHNSVLYIPENNMWLTCYHRYNYGSSDRRPCIDRLVFNEDGSIRGVVQTDSWSTDDDFGPDESNLALTATPSDSGYNQYGTGSISALNDGDMITYWQYVENAVIDDKTAKTLKNCWVQLDFGKATQFKTVVIAWESGTKCIEDGFAVEYSDDGETWTKATVSDMEYGDTTTVTVEAVTARYMRVDMTKSNNDKYCPKIFELSVYN